MAWRNPTPTVDVIIVRGTAAPQVLLIRRKNPPLGWALPGGFVDEGERVETAAVREAKEETGLNVQLRELFHVYSDPKRDPRKHTMSVVFTARVEATTEAEAGDDATELVWVELDVLKSWLQGHRSGPKRLPIAFDHAEILRDWLRYRNSGERPALRPSPAAGEGSKKESSESP